MLNLNDEKYKEKLFVNEENILSFINEYSIFRHYVGEFHINRIMESPLRKDNHPSFGIFWSKKIKGKLLFKDLATGAKGSCFNLVMYLYGLNYMDALSMIINDFNLQDYFVSSIKPIKTNPAKKFDNSIVPSHSETRIEVRIRQWGKHDMHFWNSYGIQKSTLELFRIFPIDYIFINNQIIKADAYAYAFMEVKDGIIRYKIYQPYNTRGLKWLSNFVEGTISGWEQMPDKANSLIITSSLKDVCVIHELDYPSISPQTETYSFKAHIVHELYKRFKKIFIFYDYDRAGITNAYKNKKIFGFIPIFTKSVKSKDPSDYVKFCKGNTAKLQSIIRQYI